MAVIAHLVIKKITREQYDAVRAAVGWLTDLPTGGLAHMTWWEGEDCHNTGAWETEGAFGAFSETRLGPAMAALGITSEPVVTFHAAHEVFLPKATTLTAS